MSGEQLNLEKASKLFEDLHDLEKTESAYKRFSKMSYKKIRDSGLHFEDFPVIQEAIAFKLEHLKGRTE